MSKGTVSIFAVIDALRTGWIAVGSEYYVPFASPLARITAINASRISALYMVEDKQ